METEFEKEMNVEFADDSEEYTAFVEKFGHKRTTDDCYTPPIVYDAVAGYVEEYYNLNKRDFVRPFVPQGDYRGYAYNKTDVVVDNPPFSILAEIVRFYVENEIKFFLFAPNLTMFSSCGTIKCAMVTCGVEVIYENGARVNTSFVTNLEECVCRSCPELYERVKAANKENLGKKRKTRPVTYNIYPPNVITASVLKTFSRTGVNFELGKDECMFIRKLDMQQYSKTAIYGGGFLISDKKKIEREKADRERAEKEKNTVWELSDRELEVIKNLK